MFIVFFFKSMPPLLLTLVGFPADQQVQGVSHAEGVLLGQIVDRKGSPVPEGNRLAQQRSGGADLELLTLQKQQTVTHVGSRERLP